MLHNYPYPLLIRLVLFRFFHKTNAEINIILYTNIKYNIPMIIYI